MREALYYRKEEENTVKCYLCPHNCRIKDGKRGLCNVRKNDHGTLYSENYGQITALGFDPIEKKPLYHFHPGSHILSVGSFGCNLKCDFCQNWEISQSTIEEIGRTHTHTPKEILKIALDREDNTGIAYTYNEPVIYYEFMLDTAKLAREKGLKNVMVTNGFINPEPLEELVDYIDAFSIDLKAFTEEFYRKHTSSRLEPVKESLKQINRNGNFIEITNLAIPGLNDDETKFEEMVKWIHDELGRKTVLHISRYFPNYHSSINPTSVDTLKRLYDLAKEHLDYVYLGNVSISNGTDTYCDNCGALMVSRKGYFTDTSGIDDKGSCRQCGNEVFRK